LLADELAAIDHDHDQAQLWLRPQPLLTKGDRGRSVRSRAGCFVRSPPMLAVERAAGVTKFAARDGAARFERPIPSPAPVSTACAMSAPRRNDAA
jgi:hypothetical protein